MLARRALARAAPRLKAAAHAGLKRPLRVPLRGKATATATAAAATGPAMPPLSAQLQWPLLRTAAAIGLSMGFGDALCQLIESRGDGVADWQRTKTMWVIGTFVSGPLSHTWNVLLERALPGNTTSIIVRKTLFNSVYAFTISLPVLFAAVTLLSPPKEGGRRKSLADVRDKIKQDLVPTFAAGCFYWPVFNVMIFRFVPLESRAIANSLLGTVWNVYLSTMANKRLEPPSAEDSVDVDVDDDDDDDDAIEPISGSKVLAPL